MEGTGSLAAALIVRGNNDGPLSPLNGSTALETDASPTIGHRTSPFSACFCVREKTVSTEIVFEFQSASGILSETYIPKKRFCDIGLTEAHLQTPIPFCFFLSKTIFELLNN